MLRIILICLWICLLLPVVTSASIFSSFEKSLMPGELSKPHQELVDDCNNCHHFFKKDKQNQLCMDCHDHKAIKQDIQNKTGYHGRYPGLSEKPCKDCHSDHLGADANIAFFDHNTFDHKYTDYLLVGGHVDLDCFACHKKDEPFRKASSTCYDCHKEIEPHNEKLGKKCGACHSETNWLQFTFDHSITKFKLHGKHQLLQCNDCHPNENYINTPKKCITCHKHHDKHEKRFGEKCEKCHNEISFTQSEFDHDKDTKYKLKNSHKLTSCISCHKNNPYKEKTKSTCISCHKKDDQHKGLYGEKCQDCHIEKRWKDTIFDHDKTDFQLKGKHKSIACNACHTGEVYDQELSSKCQSCHIQHDVHHGNQGENCGSCHNEKDWLDKVKFNHQVTKFPLLGSHMALSCEDCHVDSNFKGTKHKCINCHKDDDFHKQTLGNKCHSCHFAKDWKAWRFDHDKQTDFKLTGKHKNLECSACHKTQVKEKIEISSNCVACHLIDDVHEGRFSHTCSGCHNTESFSKVNVD